MPLLWSFSPYLADRSINITLLTELVEKHFRQNPVRDEMFVEIAEPQKSERRQVWYVKTIFIRYPFKF